MKQITTLAFSLLFYLFSFAQEKKIVRLDLVSFYTIIQDSSGYDTLHYRQQYVINFQEMSYIHIGTTDQDQAKDQAKDKKVTSLYKIKDFEITENDSGYFITITNNIDHSEQLKLELSHKGDFQLSQGIYRTFGLYIMNAKK